MQTHGLSQSHGSSLRSEEHTSELQSHVNLVCRLLLEKKNQPGGPESNHYLNFSFTLSFISFFFFTDSATTEFYTLSLHDALPISVRILILQLFPRISDLTFGIYLSEVSSITKEKVHANTWVVSESRLQFKIGRAHV